MKSNTGIQEKKEAVFEEKNHVAPSCRAVRDSPAPKNAKIATLYEMFHEGETTVYSHDDWKFRNIRRKLGKCFFIRYMAADDKIYILSDIDGRPMLFVNPMDGVVYAKTHAGPEVCVEIRQVSRDDILDRAPEVCKMNPSMDDEGFTLTPWDVGTVFCGTEMDNPQDWIIEFGNGWEDTVMEMDFVHLDEFINALSCACGGFGERKVLRYLARKYRDLELELENKERELNREVQRGDYWRNEYHVAKFGCDMPED